MTDGTTQLHFIISCMLLLWSCLGQVSLVKDVLISVLLPGYIKSLESHFLLTRFQLYDLDSSELASLNISSLKDTTKQQSARTHISQYGNCYCFYHDAPTVYDKTSDLDNRQINNRPLFWKLSKSFFHKIWQTHAIHTFQLKTIQ